eukprot:gene28479-34377_t
MIKKSSSPKGSNSPPSKQASGSAAVQREKSIHEPEKVKVFVTTWNMGNAEAVGMNNIFDELRATEKFDIFAIGLQESTYKCDTDSIQHLAKQVTGFLGPNFFQVEHCHRAQLQLYVFARTSLKHRIRNVDKSIENTGILHVFPNKGGLLVTFTIDGTKLAFVSCHLAAHEGVKHCEDRNASIVEILGGARTGNKDIDITEQFHHVIWMGDMNYRTTFDTTHQPANTKKNIAIMHEQLKNKQVVKVDDVGMSFGGDDDESGDEEDENDAENEGKSSKKMEKLNNMRKVLDMIAKGQYTEVLKYDELNREIAANRVLNEFIALQPNFPPTFKRARQRVFGGEAGATALTDRESLSMSSPGKPGKLDHPLLAYYNEKRLPSFTDRILYKSMTTFRDSVRVLFFESVESAISSDHKPVRAGFEISLSKGIEEILVDKNLLHRKNFNDAKTLRLVVSDLKGYDLEEMDSQLFGGGSDPYIVFTTDPPSLMLTKSEPEGIKSTVIKHDLNPVWPDKIDLTIASIDIEALSYNASLTIQVWDEDLYNPDDLIGVCSIPFRCLFEAFLQNQDFHFNEVLRSNSEVMGRISGKIQVSAGDLHEIVMTSRQMSQERYRQGQFIPLSLALHEANNGGGLCGCQVM